MDFTLWRFFYVDYRCDIFLLFCFPRLRHHQTLENRKYNILEHFGNLLNTVAARFSIYLGPSSPWNILEICE
jgi:hypothetical protein